MRHYDLHFASKQWLAKVLATRMTEPPVLAIELPSYVHM